MQMPPMIPAEVPAHWLAYFAVADIEASTAKAKSLGAMAMVEAMEAGDVGRFSVLGDPQGAVFAIIQLNEPDVTVRARSGCGRARRHASPTVSSTTSKSMNSGVPSKISAIVARAASRPVWRCSSLSRARACSSLSNTTRKRRAAGPSGPAARGNARVPSSAAPRRAAGRSALPAQRPCPASVAW